MKKKIEISIVLENPTSQATNEVIAAIEDALDDIEYLLPKTNINISLLPEN